LTKIIDLFDDHAKGRWAKARSTCTEGVSKERRLGRDGNLTV
jgi:hypothetical protein